MKISEVTVYDLMEYARETNTDDEIIRLFELILSASKSYIKSYTGLSNEQLDDKEDLTITLFVIATEMYEKRLYTESATNQNHVNKVIKSILDMYSINYL